MTRKRIFIGSASETKDELALPIADRLSELGFDVARWWSLDVFRGGDVIHERLREIAGEVDGAVFICKGTDRVVWMGNKDIKKPRDNVIFELGMFFQRLDPHLCIVVTDEDSILPSDLKGLMPVPLRGDANAVAERVGSHFVEYFSNGVDKGDRQFITVEIDPYIADIGLRDRVPKEWHARALYFGNEGGRRWLAMVTDPDYLKDLQKHQMLQQLLRVVACVSGSVSSVVSFGPGDSAVDRALVLQLTTDGEELQYIPVDISEGLLNYSCRIIQGIAQVPFGLLTDFEDRMNFVKERLQGKIGKRALVSLLGNAFGNLDRREASFMKQIESLLRKGDYLLLEVAIATPKWSFGGDIRFDMSQHNKTERYFYSQGLARQTGETLQSIYNSYVKRIVSQQGSSDVEGARAVEYVDSRTKKTVISLRRYNWNKLRRWLLSKNFNFSIEAQSSLRFDKGEIGIGAVLLKKR